MKTLSLCFVLMFALMFATDARAQSQVTVQLPTFHVTSISTTVSVPVGGSLTLGGVHRASLGRTHFGPLNRALSRNAAAAQFSIGATLIDHDQIDRALLAEAARRRGAKFDVRDRPVASAPKLPVDIVGQRWRAGKR